MVSDEILSTLKKTYRSDNLSVTGVETTLYEYITNFMHTRFDHFVFLTNRLMYTDDPENNRSMS